VVNFSLAGVGHFSRAPKDQQTKFGTFTRVGVTGRLFLSSSTIGAGGGTKSCFSPYTKFKSYG
jgi:hypothetical protein